jgi:methylenetetrahydrofolate dehydrogenase (NADP+)/methenyltetrahydrofolate cyclohydrolase
MAILLDGKATALKNEEKLSKRVETLKRKLGFTPALATILVGDFAPSRSYVKMKRKACERVGLDSILVELPNECTTEELYNKIIELNNDPKVCGILLQHPTPKHIDEQKCFNAIAIEKDVDGVNTASFGAMSMGMEAYLSATPKGILMLMDEYKIPLEGKKAVVVGRSQILGKPMAMGLLNRNCTVTICHSKTKDLPDVVRGADIVVGAVGKPEFIKGDWIKDGAVVIDAGYNEGNVGDIELKGCIDRCGAYTPVPGGVGPMTINALITQAVESCEKMMAKVKNKNNIM